MGIPLKSSSQFVIVVCLLLALLCANTHRACSLSSTAAGGGWGNAPTWDAVEYAAEDEEFLMESEVSRRILVSSETSQTLKVLEIQPFCDSKERFANCDSLRVNKQSRPCDVENRCSRNIS